MLAVQAYGLRSGPDDLRLTSGDVNFSRTLVVRELMVKNGDAARPIWATEMGWNAPPARLHGPIPYGAVSEQLQARYTVRRLRAGARGVALDGRDGGLVLQAAGAVDRQPWYFFRMVSPDFRPYPVYDALRAYAGGRADACTAPAPALPLRGESDPETRVLSPSQGRGWAVGHPGRSCWRRSGCACSGWTARASGTTRASAPT